MILLDSEQLEDDAREVIYYFDKPWKWDKEHSIWESQGRPSPAIEEDWETYCNNAKAWMV
jgi:hypothetical protein